MIKEAAIKLFETVAGPSEDGSFAMIIQNPNDDYSVVMGGNDWTDGEEFSALLDDLMRLGYETFVVAPQAGQLAIEVR